MEATQTIDKPYEIAYISPFKRPKWIYITEALS